MSAPSVVTSRDCHSQVCSASSGTLGPVLQPLPHRCHTLWGSSCEHTQRRTDRPPFPNTPFVLHLSPTQPSLSLAPNLDPRSDAVLRPLACYQVRGSVGPDREPCPVALPWHCPGTGGVGLRCWAPYPWWSGAPRSLVWSSSALSASTFSTSCS